MYDVLLWTYEASEVLLETSFCVSSTRRHEAKEALQQYYWFYDVTLETMKMLLRMHLTTMMSPFHHLIWKIGTWVSISTCVVDI